MKPKTKKKPVKRAATPHVYDSYAKPATLEPMVFKWVSLLRGGAYYTIAERDLPRVVEAIANDLATNFDADSFDASAKSVLRAIGIDVEVSK